jgi:predicted AlkP superfamily pyrophosphatase or phosphodiesterase
MIKTDTLNLVVFIDAFGWDLLQRNDFLPDVLTHRAPLGTVLGYSSTCIPTILTGQMPQKHGHFSFFYYSPDESPFGPCRPLRWVPKTVTRRGRARRLISRALQRGYGYSGYFQLYNMPFESLDLFDYSEKKDIYLPNGINGGSQTIFDELRDRQVRFSLSDWRGDETANLELAIRDLEKGEVEFAYIYLPAMDGLMHTHGTRASVVAEKIRWYDQQIRCVLETAERRYRDVNICVFSDHGMTDIHTHLPLMNRIEELNLSFGKDYAAVYDSTMARFWFFNSSAERQIVEALSSVPLGRTLNPADLEEYGCNFPNQKYGELFFLVDPGVLICPSHMGEKPLAAMHGYDPSDRHSVAMICSSRELYPAPRRLDDMYELMLSSVLQEEGVLA